jgi:hypothetical protein
MAGPRKPPAGASWLPPAWDIADASAIQALARGEADSHQQKRAMDFIITKLCATYDLSFRPGGEDGRRATDFAEGRRMVGTQIVKHIHLNLSKLREAKGGAPDEQR